MPGAKDLPEADLQMVRDLVAKMLAGEFTRFDVSLARSRITRATKFA